MKATAKNIQAVSNEVMNNKTRSAWDKGVKAYALEMLESFEEWQKFNESEGLECLELDERTALNGASDWDAWSYGGCGLVYDSAIAERLCTPSEMRKLQYKTGAMRSPAPCTNWLDIEARAARQAWQMIARAMRVVEA